MPLFLTLEEVLELHAEQIEHYGGDPGIRDLGLVESAVAMPASTFDGEYLHEGLFAMAAAYTFHLAECQGFVDGNKRVALAAAYIFLGLNGYRLQESGERLYRAMIDLSARKIDKVGLATLFRELAEPFEDEAR